MKLVELPKDESVNQTVRDFTERTPHFNAVLLIGLSPQGQPFLMTSNCNDLEKSYMIAFANAFMTSRLDGMSPDE
jgi:hypothetical protein